MEQFSGNFSLQDAIRMAKTPTGQQLLQLIKGADSDLLQQALEQYKRGDAEGAKKSLSQLASDPRIRQFLENMGK